MNKIESLTDAQGVELLDALRVSNRDWNLGRIYVAQDFAQYFHSSLSVPVKTILVESARACYKDSTDGSKVRDIIVHIKQQVPQNKMLQWSGSKPLN